MTKRFIYTFCFIFLVALANASCSLIQGATPVKQTNGEKIYNTYCAGCHPMGYNAIKKGENVIGSKKIQSIEKFANFLKVPHPPMPDFVEIVNNKKELNDLYTYVQTLMSK